MRLAARRLDPHSAERPLRRSAPLSMSPYGRHPEAPEAGADGGGGGDGASAGGHQATGGKRAAFTAFTRWSSGYGRRAPCRSNVLYRSHACRAGTRGCPARSRTLHSGGRQDAGQPRAGNGARGDPSEQRASHRRPRHCADLLRAACASCELRRRGSAPLLQRRCGVVHNTSSAGVVWGASVCYFGQGRSIGVGGAARPGTRI